MTNHDVLATLDVFDGTIAFFLASERTLEPRSEAEWNVAAKHLRHFRLEVAEVERREKAERSEVE